MQEVILAYREGDRIVTLAGIPRTGDYIRLDDMKGDDPSLLVERVQWLEGSKVMIFVRREDRRSR